MIIYSRTVLNSSTIIACVVIAIKIAPLRVVIFRGGIIGMKK